MKIEVTQDHIDCARRWRRYDPKHYSKCCCNPIAFALAEAGFDRPCVSTISPMDFFDGHDEREAVNTPKKVVEFIKKFDEKKLVKPFTFNLNV